ncbi:MAG: TonB-dependent receptor [Gammaproteobacteria bacterium]|nr:MAG: TonB-dependent receptor [Gammaproteobacteria bacterium]
MASRAAAFVFLLCLNFTAAAESTEVEEIRVIADRLFRDTTVVSPTSRLTAEDIGRINVATTEDAISLEPSLVVRRRYIGDPNGVIGIRGANMFQTTRSMVFADGLPLHYLLQTSFSGAPRWSLIAPDEIATAEVIYGPFSAEYSGNAMGGVVNITTRIPHERRVHVAGTYFSQNYDALGTDANFDGHRLFASFEDRFGDLGVYLSVNRLRNDGQPQSQFSARPSALDPEAVPVTGAFPGIDAGARDVIYYGDAGGERAATDLYKARAHYDLGAWQLRGTVAYEERDRRSTDANNFLTDAAGDPVWHGPVAIGGSAYTLSGGSFEDRRQQRRSLLLGAGVSAPLGNGDWVFDLYATHFEILQDDEIRSGRNPQDPAFDAVNAAFGGRFIRFDDTRWQTLDVKAGTGNLFDDPAMRLSVGYHFDRYELGIEPFAFDAASQQRGAAQRASGGRTGTHALFAQWGRGFGERFDLALGLRYETWRSRDGFVGDRLHPNRSENGFSPKFSLAYFPTDDVTIRYSAARALRFPVTEELFQNVDRTTAIATADASLKPEDGIHHNLSVERRLATGMLRLNLFLDDVDDVIFSQRAVIEGVTVSGFLPVDRVVTRGVEVIYNQSDLMQLPLDLRFNLSWMDAEIRRNGFDPSVEGNAFPRLPTWRGNVLLAWRVNPHVELSAALRFASNSFGNLDNSDRARRVFGAQDPYRFVNLRANWRPREHLRVSAGVDNLFNQEAYVFHPWPSRTLFFETSLSL